MTSVTWPAWMMPVATVAATLSEMNAPTKLSTEASAIAVRGASARVEIEEATTLAVSWKPLVKSNASAATTTITSRSALCTPRRLWHAAARGGSGGGAGRGLGQDPVHQLGVYGAR